MMEEAVARDTFIYNVGIEQRHDTPDAVAGYQQFSSHNLVTQLYGLTKQRAIVVDSQQTFVGGIARIEQTGVYLHVALAEIISQDAVVEQQLHVMAL